MSKSDLNWSLAVSCITVLSSLTAHAAVITDPAVVAAPNAVDPVGGTTVTLSPGSTPAELNALSNLVALQSFSGFEMQNDSEVNIVSFTGTLSPDIQLTVEQDLSTADVARPGSNATFATSANDYLRFRHNGNARTLSYLIDFGNYDNTTLTFDPGTNAVQAAGFTISDLTSDDLSSGGTVSVTFLDDDGNVLATQSPTLGATTQHVLFGLDTGGGTPIGAMRLTVDFSDDRTSHEIGFDDLAFTLVPEPGSLLLLSAGLTAVFNRRWCV